MEKIEVFDRLAATLSEHPEILESALSGLEKLLKILAKLNDSGILDAIDGILGEIDSAMNATFRADFMMLLGNIMALLYILNQIDYSILIKFADKLPKAIKAASEELDKEHKGMGIFELLKVVRKPEITKLIKALEAFSKNI